MSMLANTLKNNLEYVLQHLGLDFLDAEQLVDLNFVQYSTW